MGKEQPVLPILEKAWNATAKLLLGSEIGNLPDFDGWLSEFPEPMVYRKSGVSGKDVAYAVGKYCPDAKWLSLDEVDYSKKFEPLSINQLKDVDSIMQAVQEMVYYTGGVVLGKSGFVEKSSNVADSFYVYRCSRASDCKHIAHSSMVKQCEYVFGSSYMGRSRHCVRGLLNANCARTLEIWNADTSSDCYFGSNLRGCNEAMFSFNLWGKRHVIGNLGLEKEKYFAIKRKLLGEIAGELKDKKTFPSIGELVSEGAAIVPVMREKIAVEPTQAKNAAPIDGAFAKTTHLLFGKAYSPAEKYAAWLSRDMIVGITSGKSSVSGKPVFMGDFKPCGLYPENRLVTFDESMKIGGMAKAGESEAADLSLATLPALLGKVGYMTPEFRMGVGENIIECPVYEDASNCMRCYDATFSKYCAYCFWARDSEHLFGTSMAFSSSFCMKCYNSVRITRCFEVDSSSDCSGCYFCHNCENVHDSMFCFNVKNKRYAIGNVEVGPERLAAAKKMLLEWICRQLDGKQAVG
jgi:hypothetical protein